MLRNVPEWWQPPCQPPTTTLCHPAADAECPRVHFAACNTAMSQNGRFLLSGWYATRYSGSVLSALLLVMYPYVLTSAHSRTLQ